jgi:hypothetical protein
LNKKLAQLEGGVLNPPAMLVDRRRRFQHCWKLFFLFLYEPSLSLSLSIAINEPSLTISLSIAINEPSLTISLSLSIAINGPSLTLTLSLSYKWTKSYSFSFSL